MRLTPNTRRPTWAVVATVKEDTETIEKFIAHYKSIGAHEIHIFFDDPNDPAFKVADAIEGVFATRCSVEFWQSSRPDRHETRQNQNARRAYSAFASDWIIHLDADEYLYCANGVAQLLEQASDAEIALRVIPAEPLIHPVSSEIKAYHSPLPRNAIGDRIGHRAFGDIYPIIGGGMLSHAQGKFFLRAGLPKTPIRIHRPKVPADIKIRDLPTNDILLLHHHGADEETWVQKFQLR